jgi:hypothetical protein
MADYMKNPCDTCPFRHDVNFHFSNERAEELAYLTQNPYNSFPCHKTADLLEDDEGYESGYVHGKKSKECASFLTMQINQCGDQYNHKGFVCSDLAYDDAWAMISRYEEQNEDIEQD